MTIEDRTEVEALLEELFARHGVLEAMQAQVLNALAGLVDDPQASIRMTMADVVTTMRRHLAQSEASGDPVATRVATKAVAYAEDLSQRMSAAPRHRGRQSTQ